MSHSKDIPFPFPAFPPPLSTIHRHNWSGVAPASMADSGENSAPLLEKKVYYDNCPGCMLDKKKDSQTGMPFRGFFYIGIATLCTSLPISSLFPFLYFMIRDLHIAKKTEDIGFYAGFVGSAFMLGRSLTSMFWGIMADRYGRKPVILLGAISVIIFNALFGLSTNYWMAIGTRFVLGCLNGILGPIKAYASEICRPEHEGLGLSLVSTSLSMGLIIGPSIGGYLAQPADKYPNIFSKESIFGRFPYFLPCLFISIFAAIVFIACLWLPETLHNHKESEGQVSKEDPESCECGSSQDGTEEKVAAPKKNLLKNWPLMSCINVYCIVSLHNMAYTEIFSLWAESDKSYGGLSFSTTDVGQVLAISGASLLVFQLFIYRRFEKLLGPVASARTAAMISIPLLSVYPLFTNLSGITLTVVVNAASIMKNVLSVIILTRLFVLQNNAVDQDQRGAANGIAMTAMSLFKAIAPAGAGAIFAWAQKRQTASFLSGDQMVFFILNLISLLAVILTFKPFLTTRIK